MKVFLNLALRLRKGILSTGTAATPRGPGPRSPAGTGAGLIKTIRSEQGGDVISNDTRAKGLSPRRDRA